MNPTVKAVLLNERIAVLSAIAAREGTVSDLLVQLNGVENDIRRLQDRLVDLEAYLTGHRVALPDEAAPEALTRPDPAPEAARPSFDALGLPACKPLGDFVRQRTGKRRAPADAPRQVETA